jgi:hypothetical protein
VSGFRRTVVTRFGCLKEVLPRQLGLWALFASLFSLPVIGLDLDPVLIGSWPGFSRGDTFAVAVNGRHAYVGIAHSGVVIFDVRDPANPQPVGALPQLGSILHIKISGSYAFAVGDGGLHILDLIDPALPVEVGRFPTDDFIHDLTISGSQVYLGGEYSGLQIIDVANPSDPQLVGSFHSVSAADSVAVTGNYAYVVFHRDDLTILDVGNPANPRVVGNYYTNGYIGSVTIAGNYAYLGEGFILRAFDISNPANPQLVSAQDGVFWSDRVAFSGSHAFAALGISGVSVFDLAAPGTPTFLGTYRSDGYALDVAVADNKLFVADEDNGLAIYSATNGANLEPLVEKVGIGRAQQVALYGHYAYLADSEGGLEVLNVSKPTQPGLVRTVRSGEGVWGIAVVTNHAHVPDGSNGLRVFDLTDPSDPKPATANDNGAKLFIGIGLFVEGARLLHASDGVQVIDFSDDATPLTVGRYPATEALGFAPPYAYVREREYQLTILDTSDASNPVPIGSYSTPGVPSAVAKSGNILFVGTDYDGWHIVDVTNPARPFEIAARYTFGGVKDVKVSGSYLFVLQSLELNIFDIREPANPKLIGTFDDLQDPHSISIDANLVFLADGNSGMRIIDALRVADPQRPAVEFSRPFRTGAGEVRLSAFGPYGRVVTIQRSTDLRSWEDWQDLVLGTTPIELIDSEVNSEKSRFYRAVSP